MAVKFVNVLDIRLLLLCFSYFNMLKYIKGRKRCNMYDYLIVGSGLFGCVFAHEATKRGKKCLVLEKRSHVGGNVYNEEIEGINVHKYGAHIFHTNDEEVWEYVNQFVKFNNYVNSPVANYKGELYNMPFNMNTFAKMWNIVTPQQAQKIIKEQSSEITGDPKNLEEQAISLVGRDIYQKLVKGYTEKQWGRDCKDLPAFIIKRLPLRFTFDNNYFNDPHQGIPMGGYNVLIDALLRGCDVKTNVDFLSNRNEYENQAKAILYTGALDVFYAYRFGKLEYRSLRFETEVLDNDNYQGVAVMNYTDRETPYTRIIEHKHFEFGKQEKTVITREYPENWHEGLEPYYPVNDERNTNLYKQYKELADKEEKFIFGGRLAEYKYYDMDKVIRSALDLVKKHFG